MMEQSVRELVIRLNSSGIYLWREGERLRYKASKEAMTQEVLQSLKSRKEELLDFLGSPRSGELASIPKRDFYPASSQQRRLFALQQFDLESVAYNIPGAYILGEDVDIATVQAASKALIARHEALRTRFEIIDGELVQRVDDQVAFDVEVESVELEDVEARVSAFVRSFDLGAAPLLRIKLLRLKSGETVLLTDTHHAISDGVSSQILIRDFGRLFAGKEIEPLSLHYRDYAVWQQEGPGQEILSRQGRYWRRQFEGEIATLELPTDYPRPPNRDLKGAVFEVDLDRAATASLRAFCQARGVSMYMALLALYSALISRLGRQEDVVVGSAVAGRDDPALQEALGMFVNTLAMRSKPSLEKRFDAYLEEVKQVCLDALEHQQYPFEDLIDHLDLERDTRRNPLFDTMLIVQNFAVQAGVEGLASIRPYPLKATTSKFDISLFVVEESDALRFSFEYATSLYREESMAKLANRLVRCINAVTKDPHQRIRDIELLDTGERSQLLDAFNDTAVSYPLDKRVHELFAEQVARTPDAVAVETIDQRLTFRELDDRSSRLARHLQQNYGVTRESVVALLLDRSADMIVAILGVLKAGGAYLPIDRTYPLDRIRYALEDSKPVVALCQELRPDLEGLEVPFLEVSSLDLSRFEGEFLPVEGSSRDLAYVIYTSGSTGRPKGTLCEHRGLVNRLLWMRDEYGIGAADAILQKTTCTFDVSVWELLLPGITGARLCFLEPKGEMDPAVIEEAIDAYGITTLHFVPSMLSVFLQWLPGNRDYPCLRRVICSGEELTRNHRDLFFEKLGESVELHNLYGPTEASIDVTAIRVSRDCAVIPIGKPVANTQLYITDALRRIVPIGVVGELCIGGVQLARGYLGRDELTAERFVESPFASGERLYRTGDLARWLPDGNIEYLGRIDNQVKIRGIRVELGEIELALKEVDGVNEAVAIVSDAGANAYLTTYYVSDEELEADALRLELGNRLPAYLVPSRFIRLDRIPLTSSGKVDRKALVVTEFEGSREIEYMAPRNELEESVAAIWREILKVEKVGLRDNFFSLGGQSLRAVQVKAKLDGTFDISIPLMSIMNGTVESLSATIMETRTEVKEEKSTAKRFIRAVGGLIGKR